MSALYSLPPRGAVSMGVLGAGLGLVKGLKVMHPAALRSVARIEERGEGNCAGSFLSWRSWLFVAGMAIMGKWLRSAGITPWVLGPLLLGVGVGLFVGVRVFWGAFLRRFSR